MKIFYYISLLLLGAGCKKEVSPYYMKATINGTEQTFGVPTVDYNLGRITLQAIDLKKTTVFLKLRTRDLFTSTQRTPQTLTLDHAAISRTGPDLYDESHTTFPNFGKLIITSTGDLEAEGTFQMQMKGNPDLTIVGSFKTHL